MSGGWFALSGTALQRRAGVEDSDELFLADMVETGGGFADEALLRALVDRQANAVAAIDRAAAWTDELKVSAGMTVARAHLIRIRDLLAHPRARGGRRGRRDPPSDTRPSGLVMDGSSVTGIRSASGDLIARSGVVLASGGFSRSRELLELFVPDQAAAMPYGGVGNTGDGLRMAWMLGAGLADIGHVSGTYGQHADTTDDEHELLTANYLGAILVNARGERFADESESYKVLGSAVLSQPGRIGLPGLRLRGAGAFEARRAALRHGAHRGARAPGERTDDRGARARARNSRRDSSSARSRSTTRACRVAAKTPSGRTGLVNGVGHARARRSRAVLRVPRGDGDDLDLRRPQRRSPTPRSSASTEAASRGSTPPARSSAASMARRT